MSKVSFIIPVYNTAEYLDECVKPVLAQTFSDIEIILVDDGSTDNISDQMCDDYAARDKRVRVIHKENGGLVSAWIEGVKNATSDYLCFVDSDDWVDTSIAKELYAYTDTFYRDCEIISSNYIVEKKGEKRKETQALKPGTYTGDSLKSVRENLLGNETRPVTLSRCMKLISRQLVLDNIKYSNPKITMSEDVNISLPCLCDCKRLVIVEGGYFYHYRLVGSSMAHAFDERLLTNLDLTDKTFREILHDKNVENADAQLDREYILILIVILKNLLRSPSDCSVKRVREIFLREDIRKKVTSTQVDITSKSGKLLYKCIKNPNAFWVTLCKLIIKIYDKKTN